MGRRQSQYVSTATVIFIAIFLFLFGQRKVSDAVRFNITSYNFVVSLTIFFCLFFFLPSSSLSPLLLLLLLSHFFLRLLTGQLVDTDEVADMQCHPRNVCTPNLGNYDIPFTAQNYGDFDQKQS